MGGSGRRRRQEWSAAQSASGASTFLRRLDGTPGFPPQPHPETWPPSPLWCDHASAWRLCRADLPAAAHSPRMVARA